LFVFICADCSSWTCCFTFCTSMSKDRHSVMVKCI
jgi:hypothetical protein